MLTKEEYSEFIKDSKWLDILYPFLEKQGEGIFKKIKESKQSGKRVFPEPNKCFNAFNLCPWDKVRVVILGQDPYTTPGVADGLAFSSGLLIYCPPSLSNIFNEIETDIFGGHARVPENYSLERWAEQGVLLINTALTVEEGSPGSHLFVWNNFTNYVLKKLSEEKTGLIFLLWGGHAKGYKSFINEKVHHILESGHPSPLSANKGHWYGNKHFSQTNKILISQNGSDAAIKW